MILAENKRLQERTKIKKRQVMVMFIAMNSVKNLHFNLQTRVRSTRNGHK